MKLLRILTCFVITFGVISFQSCENEPVDTGILSNNDGNNNGNDDDPGDSTGDYWPRAIGNSWEMDDTFYGDVTYNMVSTENIDGNTWYAFDDLFGGEAWMRKEGDSYYVRTVVQGFPIEGYDVSTTNITVKMLVDSAQEGEMWNSDVSYTITYTPQTAGLPEIPDIDFSASYNFEMIGRDLTRTVEGTEYENVLHVRLNLSAAGTVSTVDYYYALDVGIIEFIGDASSAKLTAYSLN